MEGGGRGREERGRGELVVRYLSLSLEHSGNKQTKNTPSNLVHR